MFERLLGARAEGLGLFVGPLYGVVKAACEDVGVCSAFCARLIKILKWFLGSIVFLNLVNILTNILVH